MGMPKLETCCFIFDLKTGNIIIGCINAFFSFIMTIFMIVVASGLGEMKTEVISMSTNPEDKAAVTGAYAMSIILVLMFLAKFLFDVFFVYGVGAERAGIIKAYMIMWIVFIVLSLFTFFFNVMNYSGWHIFFELVYIALNFYAILLNHSFYKSLNNREEV